MKKPIIASIIGVVAIAGYIASPYASTQSLANAIQEGDRKELRERIDFENIRSSLKEQLGAAMTMKIANDEEMKNNPFAAMGAALATQMVDGAVNNMITPSGLSAMIQSGKADSQDAGASNAKTQSDDNDVNWDAAKSMGFTGLTEFTIQINNDEHPETPIIMTMELNGFGWKLTDIDMTDLLAASQ